MIFCLFADSLSTMKFSVVVLVALLGLWTAEGMPTIGRAPDSEFANFQCVL